MDFCCSYYLAILGLKQLPEFSGLVTMLAELPSRPLRPAARLILA
jgi:hypothetical protein